VLTKSHDDGDGYEWSIEPGDVDWAFQTPDGVEHALNVIDGAIASAPGTQTANFSNKSKLRTELRKFEAAERTRLVKQTQMPLDAPAARTLCWMEVQ
jgi:hypothetical protein